MRKLGPWPDVATARLFLACLAGMESAEQGQDWAEYARRIGDLSQLGDWLVAEGIGPLAKGRFQHVWPELSSYLQADAFAAAAENSLHFERLKRVGQAFERAGVQFALLKGAALAFVSYPDPLLRTMSDIDIWICLGDMQPAYQAMTELGFRAYGNENRPPKLQQLALGEVQFYDDQRGLVELHWSPISGWLLKNTADIDVAAIWSRSEELEQPALGGRILAAEDVIIQLALHTAVNHRFQLAAVRSLIDIALTAKQGRADWQIVVERAGQWRVTAVMWCVLDLVQALIGIPEMQAALVKLQPSRLRRRLIRQFVSPESILTGEDRLGEAMQGSPTGYLFLLLMIERPVDAIRLFWRAIWPRREWLDARYGEHSSRWQHLRHLIGRGRI